MARKRKAEPHVRLYRHELECAAYRSLSCEARALLVEARALYSGGDNRIYLSVRQIRERLGVGQDRAQRARDELIDRGFLRLLKPGAFHYKKRHAPEYALTNEPLKPDQDGSTAPKDFMRWPSAKNRQDGSQVPSGTANEYRKLQKPDEKCASGTDSKYRQSRDQPDHGTDFAPPDRVTRASWVCAAAQVKGKPQEKLLLAGLVLAEDAIAA